MPYICLIIGTILAVAFVFHLLKGAKYESMVEILDENEFPLNQLYVVGLSWSATQFLALKEKRANVLKANATLLYEPQYADYYAAITWAQAITLVHLFLTITFLAAGIMGESALFIIFSGVFLSLLAAAYSMENMKNMIGKRTAECEQQLPEVVSTIAVLVNSGMLLREAWNLVAESREGEFYSLMRKATENMRNGYSDADSIFLFGKASNSVEIKKFTSALLQSMEKGGNELSIFLAQQSSELWGSKRQHMLQEGERAATKLLIPIVLIFVGIIIIVMTAAFAGSLF